MYLRLAERQVPTCSEIPTWRFQNASGSSGAVAICGPCCGKHGIDPLPKVEFDELLKFSAIYEVAVKPVVDQIAIKEMARDQ